MAEFEWPEIVEQNINTNVFVGVGTVVTLYAPVGADPSTYPERLYVVEEIEDRGPGKSRVKLRRRD